MHRLVLAATLAVALLPAAASAGLINTPPTSSPPLVGSGSNRPAPPVSTTRFTETMVSGWKLQLGQQSPGSVACGGDGNFFARVSPAKNGAWTYRFVRSDGSSSVPVTVPAAPEIGGHWAPANAPFAKEVEDRTQLHDRVTERFEVTFEGTTMITPSQYEVCK